MNPNSHNAKWKTWFEAFQLFLYGKTLQSCLPVALIVGLLLSTINQSDVILNGAATTITWLKVGMNFVIPFCVSSYGILKGCRLESPIVI
ncbi:nitrate/nitrite transporter NrtS [Methanolobus sp. ZRKC4]|uniref:nitrate/nitrite transporter NrtS n=1 Tax=unclassified Methanolobus TaxID=2629569 RepID=UPI0038734AEA